MKERPDHTELSIGQPYPEELEELGVHEGAKEEQQEHDPVLHEGDEAAHRVARAALELEGWLELRASGKAGYLDYANADSEYKAALKEYGRIMGERA